MSKRNLIYLIIIFILGLVMWFGFSYFKSKFAIPENKNEETSFISKFNPFKTNTPKGSDSIEPEPVTGVEPEPISGDEIEIKLKKITRNG